MKRSGSLSFRDGEIPAVQTLVDFNHFLYPWHHTADQRPQPASSFNQTQLVLCRVFFFLAIPSLGIHLVTRLGCQLQLRWSVRF